MVNRPGEVIPAPDDDLCLAFANTRYWRGSATPTEELNSPDDLLRWAANGGAAAADAGAAVRSASARPVRRRDRTARNHPPLLCRHGGRPRSGRDGPGRAQRRAGRGAAAAAVRPGGWDIGAPEPSAGVLLAPVLWSAADLLVGAQLQRVRQCANPAVRLAVSRQQQERQSAVVLDERLRQPRQGASALPAEGLARKTPRPAGGRLSNGKSATAINASLA